MARDRPLLGIMLMLGFCVLAPVGDAVAKILGQTVPVGQLVLVRFAVQALILLPLVWLTGRDCRMSRRVLILTFVRTILHITGIGTMVTALKFLPLADAVAIAFVMPFIMLLLGKYALDEEIGPRRLIACLVGFIGTLFVIQPSFATVGWPALLPLAVAVNFALLMLVTRQIAKEIEPITLQAVSGTMAVAVMLPIVFVFQGSALTQLQLVRVSSFDWILLIGIGFLGTAAHLLMTWSLRYAPSATLAPMQYLEIPFATVIGFLVFGDFPNALASVGIFITMLAGLYIVLGERASARALTDRQVCAQPAE